MDRHQVNIWEAAMEKRWMQYGDLTFSKGRTDMRWFVQQDRWVVTAFLPQIILSSPPIFSNIKGKETSANIARIMSECQLLCGSWVGAEGQLQVPFLVLMEQPGCGLIWTIFRERQELSFFPLLTTSLERKHCGFDVSASELKKISLWCQYRCRHPQISTSSGESVFPSCNPNRVNHSCR